jgi:ubiquinone/menaquinone biosynthesis C-methylase UbiE
LCPTPEVDFGRLARRYDELRDSGELYWEAVEVLADEADLRGRRVLDVACGTGQLAAALAERYGCKVWGIDVSPEMIEVARARVPAGVGLRVGRAEELEFKDGWFERVVTTFAIHHFERPKAFREIQRVLQPGGIFGIGSFDPSHFDDYYLNPYFPSIPAIDRARFPTPESLEQELRGAGFTEVRFTRFTQRDVISREIVLERIRNRHISTLHLIDDEEYRAGIARAERELPDQVEQRADWLVASAMRG